MLKTILVPLDGSPLTETALEPASLLARRFNADLLLVHTLYPEQPHEGVSDPQGYLEAVAGHLRSEGVVAHISLVPLEPAQGILDEAEFSQVDLIVMTTRARSGLAGLLHPSITWEVLRQANAPIMACKVGSADDPALSVKCLPRFMTDPQAPILVPLDGSLQAESALPLARELAATFGNTLLLVSVPEQPQPIYSSPTLFGPTDVGADTAYIARAVEQADKETQGYLERKRTELASAGIRAKFEVGVGPVANGIEEIARKRQAGLIVMASHGRGWLGRLMLGSVAQKVLREVETPVLLVRRQPSSDDRQPPPTQPEAMEPISG
jgi:nucleotide-binding universal stress UspA family protein